MKDEEALREVSLNIEPDINHAQIVIDISPSSKSFDEAKEIVKELGVNITDKRYLSPYLLLLKLDVMDMREISLKLIERGFLNVKGINAKHLKI